MGTSEPNPAISGTDAAMTVFNDNPNQVTFNVNYNKHMEHTFPDSSNIASGSSASATVSTSLWPSQSSFAVQFASGDTATINLGTGIYSTNASPETFPNGRSAAVLAPGPPLKTDVDYRFWFFNGPGLLPALANSLLQANLPALLQFVNQNHPTVKITDNLSVSVTNIQMTPQSLRCVYAATLPSPGSSDWYLNAVFSLGQATVQGDVTIKGRSGDMNLSVNDVMLWVNLQIDPTLQKKPQVTKLQMSLGNYSGGGAIVDILEMLFPFIAAVIKAGATAYRVAGAINNQLNAAIINAINNVLNKIGTATTSATEERAEAKEGAVPDGHTSGSASAATAATATTTATLSTLTKPRLSPFKPRIGGVEVRDLSSWMSDPKIQAMTLGQLKIPGTHDSGTYGLTGTLSQISYNDIALLFNLSAGSAPVNGKNPLVFPPTADNPAYLGQPLYNFVMQVGVNSMSRTQNLDIAGQLNAGIRHLDLRVYYDTRDGDFYLQHALRGPRVSDVLLQIQTFLTAHASTELIFAFVSHTNFGDDPNYITKFTSLINSMIPSQNIYHQATPAGTKHFDFQLLANVPVAEILAGSSRVMFINGDHTNYTYPDTVTNTDGYAGVGWHGDKYSVEEISLQQGPPMKNPHSPLWSLSWTLAGNTTTIIKVILSNLTGVMTWGLQSIASNANAALPAFFQQYGTSFNKVDVDWLEYGGLPSVPETVINMNFPS